MYACILSTLCIMVWINLLQFNRYSQSLLNTELPMFEYRTHDDKVQSIVKFAFSIPPEEISIEV